MPNAVSATTSNVARTSKRLPRAVERALADALSLDGSDVPWKPDPANLPAAAELREAIGMLTMPQATPKHMAFCLAKLQLAFESNLPRPTADETRLRMATWAEANADLGDDLWSEATVWCLRNSKYGMPKPPDFRRAVVDKFTERERKLHRCKTMMGLVERQFEDARKPKPAAERTQAERLRDMIGPYRKFPRYHGRAAELEIELAALENRRPEAWATSLAPPERHDAPEERPAFKPDTSVTGQFCAALARSQRLGTEPPKWQSPLARLEEPPPHDAIPEGPEA